MIFKKMLKILLSIQVFIILITLPTSLSADNTEFDKWVVSFKEQAVRSGISKNVVNDVMSNVNFLPKVIEYDRYQPEFYEDTYTYIKKRTNFKKVKKGVSLYKKEKTIIDKIENKFLVEKELLLALMGIETNFGNYLGKMDIVSSLATLSFDKRRSEFFTNELLILLRLIDNGIIKKDILFGSWAGAFGNFQFMPKTIRNYAIDYNQNNTIELKNVEDSFASAANYLNKIGWKKDIPCFVKIKLSENIPIKYLNSSARDIKHKKKVKFFKNYIKNFNDLNINENLLAAVITPDKDIVENSNTFAPAYLVFSNYEKILNWNRSLRFALAVCTLKNNFKNEI
jgi:membrane-bound lytic murein transglycosylase B